jgi:hypothetical protein
MSTQRVISTRYLFEVRVQTIANINHSSDRLLKVFYQGHISCHIEDYKPNKTLFNHHMIDSRTGLILRHHSELAFPNNRRISQ